MTFRVRACFAVAFAAGVMSASALGAEAPFSPGGTITITFGATDQVEYTPPAGPGGLPGQIDPIANLRDSTGLPQDDGILDNGGLVILFEASGGLEVGYNDGKDNIGVATNKKGVDRGRVGPGQHVDQTLGSIFDGTNLNVVHTTFGMTFKHNGIVKVIPTNSDGEGTPRYIRSGFSVRDLVGHPPPGAASPESWDISGANAYIYNCNNRADSNPDNDANCLTDIEDMIWTSVRLETFDDPAISVDDGGEWSIGSATSTYVLGGIDGILDCFENTITVVDEDTGAVGVLTRLENFDLEVCIPIPYTLTLAGQELTFLAEYLGQNAMFEFNVTWGPEDIAALRPVSGPVLATAPQTDTTQSMIPLTIQQFLTTDPEYYLDVCVGIPNYEDLADPGEDPSIAQGGLISLTPPPAGFPDMSPGLADTQYGCLLQRTVLYLETDPEPEIPGDGDDIPNRVQVSEKGFVLGDWRASRGF